MKKEVVIGLDPNQWGAYGVAFVQGDYRAYPFRLTKQPRQPGDYRLEELGRLLLSGRTGVVAIEAVDCIYGHPASRHLLVATQEMAAMLEGMCLEAGVPTRKYPGRWPVRIGPEEVARGEGAWMQVLLGKPWVSKRYLQGYLARRFQPVLPMSEHHWDALGLALLAHRESHS